MTYEHQSSSTDGRFELQVEAWEARNSHWVFSPQLRDTLNDKVLFKPVATTWSSDSSTWIGTQVRIMLRKYPGDQQGSCLVAVVDCEREIGCVEGGEAVPLSMLEAELDRLLSEPASAGA